MTENTKKGLEPLDIIVLQNLNLAASKNLSEGSAKAAKALALTMRGPEFEASYKRLIEAEYLLPNKEITMKGKRKLAKLTTPFARYIQANGTRNIESSELTFLVFSLMQEAAFRSKKSEAYRFRLGKEIESNFDQINPILTSFNEEANTAYDYVLEKEHAE